jgi:hypothetical protein
VGSGSVFTIVSIVAKSLSKSVTPLVVFVDESVREEVCLFIFLEARSCNAMKRYVSCETRA